MRALEFIRDHVTFKLPYAFSYHMKTPLSTLLFYFFSSESNGIMRGQNNFKRDFMGVKPGCFDK